MFQRDLSVLSDRSSSDVVIQTREGFAMGLKNPCLCIILLSCFLTHGYVFAEGKAAEDVKSTSVEIKKADPSDQISLDESDADKTSKEAKPFGEAGRKGVSMQCFVTNNNHTIRITAKNTNSSSRRCSSNCYYKDDRGYNGVHRCQGTVAGNTNGLFCDSTTSNRTYTITDPGAFDCD